MELGPAIFKRQIDQALYRALTNNNNLSINVSSYPFPATHSEKNLGKTVSGVGYGGYIILALCFIGAYMMGFITKEKEENKNSKQLQLISGIKFSSYWIGNFIYDVMFILLFLCVLYILFIALQLDVYYSSSGTANIPSNSLVGFIFILFSISHVLFCYVLTFIFSKYSDAQLFGFFFNFVIYMLMSVANTLYYIPDNNSINSIGKTYFTY